MPGPLCAAVTGNAYVLPETILSNEDLVALFPDWTAEGLLRDTGIARRHVIAPGECASDLAVQAAENLLATGVAAREEIDYVLYCTQYPDWLLPTTACVMQDRLGLPITAGALDINLGCSGFVYSLSVAKGLVETGQARNVLVLTGCGVTQYLDPADRGVRALFGDAGAATLVQAVPSPAGESAIGPLVFGTDGSGAEGLIIRRGGARSPVTREDPSPPTLHMDGPEVFAFTLRRVPPLVAGLLERAGLGLDDIDLIVPHQANLYMLEYLRKKMKLSPERFYVNLRECGNTTCCSLPIALRDASDQGVLLAGQRVMLLGFGVGYSWAGAILRWNG